MLGVKVVNKGKHQLPKYETSGSAGMDLRANLDQDITILPLQRVMVKTGLYIQLPDGYEAQIRPRSGLAIKKGITLINCVGTVDSDFRGEVCALIVNLSTEPFVLKDGERIAQMVINKYETIDWLSVEELDESERGKGGFGSTGTK